MNLKKSIELYTKGKKHLVGAVNSPVRAFKSVGGVPFFIEKAKGSKIFDVDGNEYIDLVLSYGPMILGHRNIVKLKKPLKRHLEKAILLELQLKEKLNWQKLFVMLFREWIKFVL